MTYRDAVPLAAPRRPLGRVTLVGPPLRIQRGLAVGRIVAGVVAVGAFFTSWHAVYTSSGAWGPAFCWGPDCHGAPPTKELPPPVVVAEPPAFTCTGWSHTNSVLPLVLLAGIVALSIWSLRRARLATALAGVGAQIASLIALFYALFDLKHLLDRVEVLLGQVVFNSACIVIALTIVVDLLATPVLYVWARARLPGE